MLRRYHDILAESAVRPPLGASGGDFHGGCRFFPELAFRAPTGDPFPKSAAQPDGQGKESRSGYPLPGPLHSSGGYRRDGKYHRRQRCHLPGRPRCRILDVAVRLCGYGYKVCRGDVGRALPDSVRRRTGWRAHVHDSKGIAPKMAFPGLPLQCLRRCCGLWRGQCHAGKCRCLRRKWDPCRFWQRREPFRKSGSWFFDGRGSWGSALWRRPAHRCGGGAAGSGGFRRVYSAVPLGTGALPAAYSSGLCRHRYRRVFSQSCHRRAYRLCLCEPAHRLCPGHLHQRGRHGHGIHGLCGSAECQSG